MGQSGMDSAFAARASRSLLRFGCEFAAFVPERASGCWLYDSHGDRMLDFTSGQMSAILGHSHPEIHATIRDASGKIRDKHVADEEEDYGGIPAWSALYPVTQTIGAPSECARQLPGLERPADMVDFEPATPLDELMTRGDRPTFG